MDGLSSQLSIHKIKKRKFIVSIKNNRNQWRYPKGYENTLQ
jgi:hypothetical protein